MGKRKLKQWAEMETFHHVFQPDLGEIYQNIFHLKGKWKEEFFKNHNPITLELGCGKGEYTISLSRRFPDRNFIGIDIKGARIWKGAKTALTENLKNVAFLRTHIELIESFFALNEIDEIWLTFPDPQIKKRRKKKRLTSARFLNTYQKIVSPKGRVHLKTDNKIMYDYTWNMIVHNNLSLVFSTEDVHAEPDADPVLSITTFYEQQFLEQNVPIKYLSFLLDTDKSIDEPEIDE